MHMTSSKEVGATVGATVDAIVGATVGATVGAIVGATAECQKRPPLALIREEEVLRAQRVLPAAGAEKFGGITRIHEKSLFFRLRTRFSFTLSTLSPFFFEVEDGGDLRTYDYV